MEVLERLVEAEAGRVVHCSACNEEPAAFGVGVSSGMESDEGEARVVAVVEVVV